MTNLELIEAISLINPEIKCQEFAGRVQTIVPLALLDGMMGHLKNDLSLAFDFLMSHTAVDRLEKGLFELITLLHSTKHNHELMVLTSVDRSHPVVPSLSHLWRTAEGQEREVFDLMGILYDNHPDLRRLFLEDDWVGFPLRKDYKDDFMLETNSMDLITQKLRK